MVTTDRSAWIDKIYVEDTINLFYPFTNFSYFYHTYINHIIILTVLLFLSFQVTDDFLYSQPGMIKKLYKLYVYIRKKKFK